MESELIAWRAEAGRLADVQLMAELQRLARVDRRCEARILVLLAEVDERELYLARVYSSLFRYAVSVLRMSDAQACFRIGAARVARRYPVALEMLLEGALSLSTVKLLAPKLTADNHATLLERARGKTKQEVELLIAEIAPKPDVPTRLRKMPGRSARRGSAQAELLRSAPLNQSALARATAEVSSRHAGVSPGLQETSFSAGTAPGAAPSTASAPHAAVVPHAAAAIAPAATVTPVATAALIQRFVAVAHAELSPPAAAASAPPATAASLASAAGSEHAAAASAPPAAAAPAALAPRAAADFVLEAPRASCAALSPGRFKLELTVDQGLFDQMMSLKHLLKHRVPSGDLGVILGLALTQFSERLRKQRFAELSKPASSARTRASRNEAIEAPSARASQNEVSAQSSARASKNNASTAEPRSSHGSGVEHAADKGERRSRYVPRAVVREVFARDGAQCTFVSADGQRCAELGMLELDHEQPFAHGGTHTPENIKVVCRAHNGYLATLDFGAAHMRKMRARAR